METQTVWIYVTAASQEEGMRLARALVGERLAACANVLDGMTSVYWWEGEVQEEREVALVAKTRAELVEAVVQRVKRLHSYRCPCVVALPVVSGNPDFLAWVREETRAVCGGS